MKIGIITINGSDNYGNVLQNYAVQQIFSELGIHSYTIKNTTKYGRYLCKDNKAKKLSPQYICKYFRNKLNYKYNIKNSGDGLLKAIKYYKKNYKEINNAKQKRKEAFLEFNNTCINWAEKAIDINYPWKREQIEKFDYYITGSDQVWNPVYPSTSSINFLQFVPQHKRIALSPSFGIGCLPESVKKQYGKWLSEIPYLSVREQQGQDIIKELCGKHAEVLCDPTMAVSKENWIKIEKKPELLDERAYVLTYFLGDKIKEYVQYIDSIAKYNKLRVINLFDVMDLCGYSISPQEFIYLIHNATLVCTDSFHGVVFSILMKTNFIAFPRIEDGASMSSRIHTLLKTFNLETRNYTEIQNEDIFCTNFSNTEKILQSERLKVFDFIKRALNNKELEDIAVEADNSFYFDKNKCVGCNACALVCPKQCIKLRADEEGFLYPNVDLLKCINCNKCKQVCPVNDDSLGINNRDKVSYIGYSKDTQIRKESSSGGIFAQLAKFVLNETGVVVGALIDNDLSVKHTIVTNEKELKGLLGSKYVQSDLGNVYCEVKKYLDEGKRVLFSGTPCQIKGLYSYLNNNNYPNLLTQDFVCHGVPSPKVWKKYVKLRNNSDSANISFRNKRYGWHYFSMKINKYCRRLDEDWYLRLFLDDTILRPVCYECPVKKSGTIADITLADCWKIKNISNDVADTDKGLSLIFLNTEKGKKYWDDLTSTKELFFIETDINKALESQKSITISATPNVKRAMFFDAFNKVEFKLLVDEWYKDSFIKIIKTKMNYYKYKIIKLLKNVH